MAKLLVAQAILVAVLSVGLWPFSGWENAASAALGGLCGYLPQLFFSWRLKRAAGKDAPQFLAAFIGAEAVKLFLAGVLTALTFLAGLAQPLYFFLGLGLVILSHWLLPALIRKED